MIEVIPAIDIIEGKCVRLTKGDYSTKKIYNEDPLEVALQFEDAGLKRLHLVDLDGAKSKHIVNWKVLEKIAFKTNLFIDFGGGLKADKDLQIAFECGASMITGGSIAVHQEEIFTGWIENYGSEKIILGADVKEEKIATNGWQQTSQENIFDFLANYVSKGIKYTICTDIAKDGMLEGSSIELYKNILEKQPSLQLIASGGVSSIKELGELNEAGLHGVIVGKAIYEGKIKLKDLRLLRL